MQWSEVVRQMAEKLEITQEESEQMYGLKHGVYAVFALDFLDQMHCKVVSACYEADALHLTEDWADANTLMKASRPFLMQRQIILTRLPEDEKEIKRNLPTSTPRN